MDDEVVWLHDSRYFDAGVSFLLLAAFLAAMGLLARWSLRRNPGRAMDRTLSRLVRVRSARAVEVSRYLLPFALITVPLMTVIGIILIILGLAGTD